MQTSLTSPSPIWNQIQGAWQLRENLKLDEFALKVMELNQFQRASVADAVRAEELHEIELLNVSWLRSRGRIDEAQALHRKIETEILEGRRADSFKFHSEAGLNRMYLSDPTGALECFMAAQIIARRTERADQEASALLNILLCLEWLEVSTAETEQKLFAVADSLAQSPVSHVGLQSLIQAYRFRKSFTEGRIGEIFVPARTWPGQPAYFRLWLRSLPYVTRVSESDPEGYELDFAVFLGQEQSYRRNYRLRTLQCSLHPDDFQAQSIADAVDRVYLWTWLWAERGDAAILERLIQVLAHFPDWNMPSSDSIERGKLRSALRWIKFIEPAAAQFVDRCLLSIPKNRGLNCALLKLEDDLLGWLESRLADESPYIREDLVREMEQSPLWKTDEHRLTDLVRAVLGGETRKKDLRWDSLVSRLEKRWSRSTASAEVIWVNPDSGEIVTFRGSESVRTVSDSLSLALALVNRQDSVTFEEFARTVFGLRKYDSFLHQPKIHNLLNRMKTLLESKDIVKTRQGRIYRSAAWPKIEVQGDGASRKSAWQRLLQSAFQSKETSASSGRMNLDDLFALEEVRVADWVEHLGRPRSTVLRYVKGWVESGLVVKTGFGKNTVYRIPSAPDFKRVLQEIL